MRFVCVQYLCNDIFGIINRSDTLEKDPLLFVDSWSVVDGDKNEISTDSYYLSGAQQGCDCTIFSTLPDGIKDNEYLFFDTRKETSVYVNGVLRKDFVEKRDVNIPGGSVKRFYMEVPLKSTDSGADIRIVYMSPIRNDQLIPNAFISTRFGAFDYLMRNNGLSFLLASIVFIFSIVVIIVSFIFKLWYRMKIDMLYGAVGIMIISAWLFTNSYLIPFIFGVYHVNGIMNYMLCLTIPFAPIVYLNSIQRGRFKKSMSVIMILSGINAVVWPTLHFTGVLNFCSMRTVMNVILTLISVTAIGILIYDAVKGNAVSYKYTFFGFLGFLICCIVELMLVLHSKSTNISFPMVVGLGVLLTFIVVQQVNDLRKIAAEKQHAIDVSEAKTKFLASMSHEIRTPINAILGMNEMIHRENSDKVIEDYSNSIKTSGKMLLMLVNDVLDFSKIEAGKLEINETRFLLSEMLYDVVSLVRERAEEKLLKIKTEVTKEIPNELISDEFRIRQILVNLLNNAVKYTEKGTVSLMIGGCYTENGFDLSFIVKDTGKGIRKEDHPKLSKAFSRLDLKSNANIEGTGLGLAIVKSIVDSMGGRSA